MTLSLNWLQDYLRLPLTPEQISDALTSLGLEVEKMETRASLPGGLAGVVAGKVLTCEKHPDADRLSLTTVDVGDGPARHIVCGAANVAAGQTVWVALPGTEIHLPDGKSFVIKVSKIRGQQSEGMICAEDELGLGDNHDGIMVLPDTVAIGTPAAEYYHVVTDTVYEIGLTPNRSDATSVLGVADDLAAFLSVQQAVYHRVQWPDIPALPETDGSMAFPVEVRDTARCPRYSGIRLSGVTVGPAPDWIRQRLASIGVKSINNVVDITNFVLHEMGQPLHAFDAGRIGGGGIVVDTLPTGTPFLALDGQTYTLDREDLIICDATGAPMCIAGVYGGLNSGVTDGTTEIFLESAHFQATAIRRTSMRLNLRTDAARRYEKGSDPAITLKALGRAVDLLQQYAGAVVSSPVCDLYPVPVEPVRVNLRLSFVRTITGVPFEAQAVEFLLEALNMTYTELGNDSWTVRIPTNKPDVTREVDVIEEILRVYGFDRITLPERMTMSVAVETKFAPHRLRRLMGQFLAARGFLEAMNLSLTQPSLYQQAGLSDPESWVTIHNTSNESLNLLRPDMLIPMLDTLRRNVNRRQDNLGLFEFGKSYHRRGDTTREQEHLILVMTGSPHSESWKTGDPGAVDFFSLKAVVKALLHRLGAPPLDTMPIASDREWAYGQVLRSGQVEVGRYGCIAESVTRVFDLRQSVYYAEFSMESLMALGERQSVVTADISRFPAVIRDLAIVVDEGVAFSEIEAVVAEAGGAWLAGTEVFDIYRHPEHVGPGRKSIALRFTLESPDAQMSDKDIDTWFARIQQAIVRQLGADIRK